MVKALFDTNIIIDYLNGDPRAWTEMERYDSVTISIITYIEVLVGIPKPELYDQVKAYLESLNLIPITQEVADLAVSLRQTHGMKVPDALVLACAQHMGALCITRDTKDFDLDLPMIRIPYHGNQRKKR